MPKVLTISKINVFNELSKRALAIEQLSTKFNIRLNAKTIAYNKTKVL